MDIGEEQETVVVEPIKDPVPKPAQPEREPAPVSVPEKVQVPERVPVER